MKIGNIDFDINNKLYIMGILNVTPDSFSDGGKYLAREAAVEHALAMVEEGADIIDIGGESTRPGYIPVSIMEEIERVVPIIEAVRKHSDIPISIDTYKPQVAAAALKAGADLVNDIWGTRLDAEMAEVIRENNVACCLMHNCEMRNYIDVCEEVLAELEDAARTAVGFGIDKSRIILDPGIGFGKDNGYNFELLKKLELVKSPEYPMLLACSKKSVFGDILGYKKDERNEATLAATLKAYLSGYAFVRVHDVAGNRRMLDSFDALMK